MENPAPTIIRAAKIGHDMIIKTNDSDLVGRAGLVDLTEVLAGYNYDQNKWDSHRINKILYESNNKYTCAAVDYDSWNGF